MPTETGTSPEETPTPSSRSSLTGRFAIGAVLGGRYRILRALGRGGMGEVYQAYDDTLDQEVALKFLPESARDPQLLKRFRAEVRIARRVSHPNVCRVYDLGEADGLPFISMEYVDGEDLRSLLRRIGRLSPDKATEMARRLCAGLAAAHAAGVLHRDLKPANIMVDGEGGVHIMDFGLADLAGEIEGGDVRSGTPAYMSPEQAEGREVTVQSDIWALGIVLSEMYTGRRASAESGTSMTADVDPAIDQVIRRCLDPNPARRPASALDVARALPGGDPLAEALAAGETPSPEMVAASDDTGMLSVRSTVLSVVAVAVGLTTIVLLNARTVMMDRIPAPYSPEVLERYARDILLDLGYGEAPAETKRGFAWAADMNVWAGANMDPADYLAMVGRGRPPELTFWYRQSPRRLSPSGPVATFLDPPVTLSGMVNVILDPDGRLLSLIAVPPAVDQTAGDQASAEKGPIDWEILFQAAGLDMADWTRAEPRFLPAVTSDERVAWTGTFAEAPSLPIRIEAAAWKGARLL